MMDVKPGKVRTFRDLIVWQRAMELVVACYAISRGLPTSELHGLRSQLCRAAVSVPANIAEGFGRRHRGDRLRFIDITHSSLFEVETHLEIARRLGYAGDEMLLNAARLVDEAGRMLTSAHRSLRTAPKSV